MKNLSVILLLLLFFGLLQGTGFCAQSSDDVSASQELKEEARKKILGTNAEHEAPEYRVGYGDILSVSIYGEGDMSALALIIGGDGGSKVPVQGVQVRVDGRVSLKHIGDVSVVGMTLSEMADYLKILYSAIYEEPVVTTVLLQNNSKRYTVMGKVLEPGVFQLHYPLNVVQVIARSKGFTEWANSEVSVVRKDVESELQPLFSDNVLKFDYDDFLKGKRLERNIMVRSGDIIIVH